MFGDALNPIIEKKSMKENWKIKGKIIYKSLLQISDYSKQGEITELKKRSKLKIRTKTIYKNCLALSFCLIIFLEGMVLKSLKLIFFKKNYPLSGRWGDGFYE